MQRKMEMKKNDQLKTMHELWGRLKPWQRKWLRIQGEVVYGYVLFMKLLVRIDLWFFPPLAFFASYNLAVQNFPEHPARMIAVLCTSFMCAALTLLLIRPARRTRAHWIKHDPH